MGTSRRIFIIEGDSIIPISQKSFNALYNYEPVFPQYGRQSIVLVTVIIELENRKPVRILRVERGTKIVIDADGSMNKQHHDKQLHLAVSTTFSPCKPQKIEGTNVIDAKVVFDNQCWEQSNPTLPYPIYQKVVKAALSK